MIYLISFVLLLISSVVQAQGLLPNGKQTFLDSNGSPLASGFVYFYVPSTTTRKNTWSNSTLTVLNSNPVVLDAAGRAVIYGTGQYRQVVKDSDGNTIWDQLTQSPGFISGNVAYAYVVNTNAALRALSTDNYSNILRCGFLTSGDAPCLPYYASNSVCPLNGGNGDNGAEVKSSNSKCWLANFDLTSSTLPQWGCVGDGVTDNSTCLASAAAWSSANNQPVYVPEGNFRWTTSTISFTGNGSGFVGVDNRTSILTCATGASGCFIFLGTSTSAQIYGVWLKNLRVTGSSLSAGDMVNFRYAAQGGLEKVVLDNFYNGFTASGTNDILLRDTQIDSTAVNGRWGVKWYSADGATERSDVLTLDHVTVQLHGGGGDCVIWDRNTQTLRINGVNLLGCAQGLDINPSAASSDYPNFLQANGLEVDSATNYPINVESYASDLTIVNSQLTTTVGAGVPAVFISAHGDSIRISASRLVGRDYAIKTMAGALHLDFVGNNYDSSTTGTISDGSGVANISGGTAHNGWPINGAIGSTPSISSCGISPSVRGTSSYGIISTGTGTVTSCTMTFTNSGAFNPTCTPIASGTGYTLAQTSSAANSVTFGFSTTIPSTQVLYHCDWPSQF